MLITPFNSKIIIFVLKATSHQPDFKLFSGTLFKSSCNPIAVWIVLVYLHYNNIINFQFHYSAYKYIDIIEVPILRHHLCFDLISDILKCWQISIKHDIYIYIWRTCTIVIIRFWLFRDYKQFQKLYIYIIIFVKTKRRLKLFY